MTLEQDIFFKLTAIRQRFLESLETTLLELDGLSGLLRSKSDPTAVMLTIRSHSHRIAGTAPSLGYKSIGDLAGEVEHAVDLWNAAQNPGSQDRVYALLESLLNEIDQVIYGDC